MDIVTSSNLKRIDYRGRARLRYTILTSILLAILVVQEEYLVLLPNIQLTTVLLLIYAAILPWPLLCTLVVSYVFIDNLIMGSFNLLYTLPMLFAWLFFVVIGKLIAKKSFFLILAYSFLFGFVYGWFYIPAQMIAQGVDILWPYFLADLEFEITMAVCNFFTVLLLYKPLVTLLDKLLDGWKTKSV